MRLSQRQVQHLYHRAGFGIRYDSLKKYIGKKPNAIVDEIFSNSKKINYLGRAQKDDFRPPIQASSDERKTFFQRSRKMIFQLNTDWLKMMGKPEASLREKMTFFWHGHFASTSNNAFLVQQQHNVINKHALGNFRDLLFAVSKDAVMLQYLNNQQNRKNAPNENFAREVMELFTVGRGNYSEEDIKDAARAFTGWGFNKDGEFIVRKRIHDDGLKTIFGRVGNFTGDDVLNILLDQKQTARTITRKIYTFFVGDEEDPEQIDALSKEFFNSGYDITNLMHTMLTSDWFYDERNIGSKIKSPVELLASNILYFGLDFDNSAALIGIQKLLGQILFRPPNVAGWPYGKEWIDSSTLMLRLRITEASLAAAGTNSPEFEEILSRGQLPIRLKNLNASMNWQSFERQFRDIKENELEEILCYYLIQPSLDKEKIDLLQPNTYLPRKYKLFTTLLKVSKLPEFQMC